MSILGLRRPRLVAAMILETGLIFLLLYLLAVMNQLPIFTGQESHAGYLSLVALVFVGSVSGSRRAILGDESDLRREMLVLGIVSMMLIVVGMLTRLAYLGSPELLHPIILIEAAIGVPAVVLVWRWISVRFEFLDGYRERVVVVGSGEVAKKSARWIVENMKGDCRLVGFVVEDSARVGQVLAMGARALTGYEGMSDVCRRHVDRIIVALDEKRGRFPIQPLMEMRMHGIEIEDATSFLERTSGKIPVESMLPSWLIFSDGFRTSPTRAAFKRTGDVVFSALLLLAAGPVMLLIAALIKFDTKGRVLFRQRRMGLNGREFDMLKFRSMVQDAEKDSGPTWAGHDDPRVTRIGRVIRRTRLDEFPQLINALRGEMSFVGPRPERRHFVEQLEKEIPYYRLRMSVRPGITGWAQVSYGYGATVADALEKLKYDLFYIKNTSFLFDLWVVIKTFGVVLLGSGAR